MNKNETVLQRQAQAILTAASETEIGLAVKTNDVMRAKAILYRFRKELKNEEYACLQIRLSPINPNGELWLLKMAKI